MVNWGVLLLVFLLPWQTRLILRQDAIGYLEISVYSVDLILIIILLISLINAKCQPTGEAGKNQNAKWQCKIKNEISVLAGLFLFWNVLSVFWASDKILALQHLAWLLLAVGLGLIVSAYENKLRLLFWLVMGLMVSAWLGIWQFFAQYAFANKWLGLAYHNPQNPGTSYLEILSNGKMVHWLRSYGSFDHPNIFGFAMVLGIISVLWIFYEKKNFKSITFLLYVALASLTAGLYTSLSRSAFLGLGIGLVVFFLKTRFLNVKKPLIVMSAVFVIFASLYSAPLLARGNINARLEQKSIDERGLYFQQGKEVIKHNSLIGVGAGNYIRFLKKENPNNPAWTYQPVHNVFMLIWAELGIAGLLAFMVLYGTIIIRAYKNSPLGFCLLLALLPAMLLDHWLWSLHFGLIFLGFILGILLKSDFNTRLTDI